VADAHVVLDHGGGSDRDVVADLVGLPDQHVVADLEAVAEQAELADPTARTEPHPRQHDAGRRQRLSRHRSLDLQAALVQRLLRRLQVATTRTPFQASVRGRALLGQHARKCSSSKASGSVTSTGRSSTTRTGRSSTTVRRRSKNLRRLQGDRLIPNSSEYSTTTRPVSRRMIPRVLTLMPGVVASMAEARMAPSTIRKMPTPMLIIHVLQGADGDASLVS